jgi:hypothetical protein
MSSAASRRSAAESSRRRKLRREALMIIRDCGPQRKGGRSRAGEGSASCRRV